MNRRKFLLQATGAAVGMGTGLPGMLTAGLAGHTDGAPHRTSVSSEELEASVLPEIPSLEDLASEPMTHRFGEPFNPPGVNNEWGHAQVNETATGLMAVSFPPFACCGLPRIAWSQGYATTCELILNDKLVAAYPGTKTIFRWFPHAVVRETDVDGLRLSVRTFMPRHRKAVAQQITIVNRASSRREVSLVFVLRAHVANWTKPWGASLPADSADVATAMRTDGCLVFAGRDTKAFSVQGFAPPPDEIRNSRTMHYRVPLGPGESWTLRFVNVLGDEQDATISEYRAAQRNFHDLCAEAERETQRRVEAALTPGNAVYSGSLPRLRTRSRALWRIYHTALTNLLYNRVETPWATIVPAYVTLRPRLAATRVYPWDLGLTPLSVTLLDPAVVRRFVELWAVEYRDKYYATDYLTGKGTGPWYAANNWAVLRCADYYLRVTGDFAWLDKPLAGRSVLDHLEAHALHWKTLDRRGVGLADYGEATNLLEVVSTYTHEVASFNAVNVYGMRLVARLHQLKNNQDRALSLQAEASALAARILKTLYVTGRGYWRCGQPDGTFNEVRHCLDFFTVLDFLQEDLPVRVRKEMIAFFWRELSTATWMHALSPGDTDSIANGRADHSWLGAYAAWPALSARILLNCDEPNRVARWVRGFALTAGQGPFGQSHLAESVMASGNGGALKHPAKQSGGDSQDWSEAAGGSFIDMIIEGVFGVALGLDGTIQVNSRLQAFDSSAALIDLIIRGKAYEISVKGTGEWRIKAADADRRLVESPAITAASSGGGGGHDKANLSIQ